MKRASLKKVIIVYDTEGWAFHHWAKGIQRYAPLGYLVDIMSNQDYGKMFKAGTRPVLNVDAVFLMSWNQSQSGRVCENMATLVASPEIMYPFPIKHEKNIPSLIATELRNNKRADMLSNFDRVLCTTNEITEFCNNYSDAKRVTIGVDHAVYTKQQAISNEKFVVGWCGQDNPTKGKSLVLGPIMQFLGDSVRFAINDRDHKTSLSQHGMANWYSSLDVFLTTGCAEGGPSPPLEAMSCGVPVVGTESGFLGELVQNNVNSAITSPYSTKNEAEQRAIKIAAWIIQLSEGWYSTLEMGKAARETVVEKFSWSIQSEHWLRAITGESDG